MATKEEKAFWWKWFKKLYTDEFQLPPQFDRAIAQSIAVAMTVNSDYGISCWTSDAKIGKAVSKHPNTVLKYRQALITAEWFRKTGHWKGDTAKIPESTVALPGAVPVAAAVPMQPYTPEAVQPAQVNGEPMSMDDMWAHVLAEHPTPASDDEREAYEAKRAACETCKLGVISEYE